MDQRNETFVPHLLAITVGTTVDFPNNDRTYHNVFSLSKRQRFDLGRYGAGHSKSVRFDHPGVVRVFCDIHSHMNAFILVFNHRFFNITDPDGRYRDRRRAARHLHAGRVDRGRRPRHQERHRGAGQPRRRGRFPAAMTPLLVAHEPHLPRQRAAGGRDDRRRRLRRRRARHARGRSGTGARPARRRHARGAAAAGPGARATSSSRGCWPTCRS